MEEYRYERLSAMNLHQLVKLYAAAFHIKTSTDFLQKKYQTATFGAQFIGFLAFVKHTDEVAAYYGVFPVLGIKDGTNFLIAQSGDTMTHPAHQGKGLFTMLARMTFELAKSEGIHFIFGFPNKNSYPGFVKKLGWTHYSDVNNYALKTGGFPFDKLFKKFSGLSGLFQLYVQRILRPFESPELLPNSLQWQAPDKGRLIHDASYFSYKSYSSFYTIRIGSTSCLIKVDGRLWLGDLSYCSEDEFWVVVTALKRLAGRLGCSAIHFSVAKDSVYDQYLLKKLVVKSQTPVCFLDLSGSTQPEQFLYQGADFDTY